MKVMFGANLWVDTRDMKPREERALARRLEEETGYPVGYQDVNRNYTEQLTLFGWRNMWPTSYWDRYSLIRQTSKGVLNAKSDHPGLLERLGQSVGLRYQVDNAPCDNYANNPRPQGFIHRGIIPADAVYPESTQPETTMPKAPLPVLSAEPFNVIEP